MKIAVSLLVIILAVSQVTHAASVEQVATSDSLWTGIAVSQSERLFVSFPRWWPDVPVSVAEIGADGKHKPYPNVEMNSWKTGDDPAGKFVCVQSIYIDADNRLWILDPGSPEDAGVVPGAARLFEVDLTNDEIVRTIHFDESIAPPDSYLNDVRVDTTTNTAFITDSNLGAIVVVDLESGNARRLLTSHPSTKAEDIEVVVRGIPFEWPVHSDGIALDASGGWLYYQALTGRTLYRVPTSALRDTSLTEDALGSRVERFSNSGVSDALLFAHEGVYVTSFDDDSIKFVDKNGAVKTVVRDARISWPDGFAIGPDGTVLFTTSQVHLWDKPNEPYRILRILE